MTALRIYEEAAAADAAAGDDSRDAKELWRWGHQSESYRHLRAMLELARSEGDIPVPLDAFDRDPFLFNCLNGTVDLRTGELRSHIPSDMITHVAPVHFDASARSDVLDRFLNDCCRGDAEKIEFLQRWAGYCLSGDTAAEKLLFVHGDPRSGKSTYVEMLLHMMGPYGDVVEFTSFLRRKNDGIRNDIAKLFGKRFVIANEAAPDRGLDESLIKQLTGGDSITTRFFYKEFFTFKPTFKITLVANDAPKVRAEDDAIWLRMLRVTFDNPVPKGAENPDLKRLLTSDPLCRAAILAWAVRGYLEYQKSGLGIPASVEAATEEYRRENDTLHDFVEGSCVVQRGDEKFYAPSGTIYDAYATWCQRNGDAPMSQTSLTRALRSRYGVTPKLKKDVGKPVRALIGIQLKAGCDAAKEKYA